MGREVKNFVLENPDVIIGMIPVIGDLYDAMSGLIGVDPLTGRKLSKAEIGLALGVGLLGLFTGADELMDGLALLGRAANKLSPAKLVGKGLDIADKGLGALKTGAKALREIGQGGLRQADELAQTVSRFGRNAGQVADEVAAAAVDAGRLADNTDEVAEAVVEEANQRVIVELGSGHFENLARIAADNPGARVIGIEKDLKIKRMIEIARENPGASPAWDEIVKNHDAAVKAGAEIHWANYGHGLPVKADEIIAIAPNPHSVPDIVKASRDLKPGGRIYTASVPGESTGRELVQRLSVEHQVEVSLTEGVSRYPSWWFGKTGKAEIIDFNIPGKGALCSFSADTLVTTEEGLQPISSISNGNQVLAYDELLDTTDVYTVTKVWSHEDPIIVYITIDRERLRTTPEHPFYTQENEWVPAGNLQIGDHIRNAGGEYGIVQAVEFVYQPQPMYNLTVGQAHTFFVGQGRWLVHNDCPPGYTQLEDYLRSRIVQQTGGRGKCYRCAETMNRALGDNITVITSDRYPNPLVGPKGEDIGAPVGWHVVTEYKGQVWDNFGSEGPKDDYLSGILEHNPGAKLHGPFKDIYEAEDVIGRWRWGEEIYNFLKEQYGAGNVPF